MENEICALPPVNLGREGREGLLSARQASQALRSPEILAREMG